MDGEENANVGFVNPPIITLGDDLQGILGVNSFDSSIFTDLLLRKDESEDELEREIQRLLQSPKSGDTLDIAEIIAPDLKVITPTEQCIPTDSSLKEQSTLTGSSSEEGSTRIDSSLEEQSTRTNVSSTEQKIRIDSPTEEQSTCTDSSSKEESTRTDSSSPCKPSILAKEYELFARSILVSSPTPTFDDKKIYACPQCPMKFVQRRYLNRHYKKHENRFSCPHCGRVFARKESKIKHIPKCKVVDPDCRRRKNRRLDKPTFSCGTCFQTFTRKENFDQHMLKHEGLRVLCDLCQKTFCSWKSFSGHRKLHEWTRTVYFCAHCAAMFMFKHNLLRHLQNVRNAIVCTVCNLSVKNEEIRDKHLSQKIKRCVICSQPFCLEKHLRIHRKVLHPEMWFTCKLCKEGTVFFALSEHNLRDHVRKTHKISLKFMECYEEGWYKIC